MSQTRPRALRMTGLFTTATAVAAGLISAVPAQAVTGPEAQAGQYASTVKLNLGDEANSRACTASLIDANWIVTAASCFAATPGGSVPAGKPALKATATLSNGQTREIVQLAPRTDRDLVLALLATPVTDVTAVKRAATAPAAGVDVTSAGFGRTKTEWVPGKLHIGVFTTNTTDATTLAITGKGTDAICKGDTGGPLLNAAGELVGVNSKSWQGGCLGTPATETRTTAVASRADDLGGWIEQIRATTPGWKTETVVQAGTSLYQGIRLTGGAWTGFTDVQSKAGNLGGIRTAAVAGIDADTHVVALGSDGRLQHTIRKADGTWGSFGDIGAVAGVLTGITQVSAVSIGFDLHVVAVADGKLFHTVRRADGKWSSFGNVAGAAGPIGAVSSAATASAAGQLQVTAISGGKPFHTIRTAAGNWSAWGDVARAAGATGPITSVSMAGIGSDAHIVIATDSGTRQYHATRKGDGNWVGFGNLTGYLGSVTAKSVAAAPVNGEFQLAATTADGRIVHIIRHADGNWSAPTPVNLQGITGTLGAITIAGTL